MKKKMSILVLLVVAMMFVSCAGFTIKTDNLVRVKLNDGSTVVCKESLEGKKGIIDCNFTKGNLVYHCLLNSDEVGKVLNFDQKCLVIVNNE